MNLTKAKQILDIPQVWRMLQLSGNPKRSCHCPWRPDKHPSFSIFAGGTKWKDHATGESGDAVDFLMHAAQLSLAEACRQFLSMASGPAPLRIPESTKPVSIPRLHHGTQADWQALSKARFISLPAITLAVERGLLWFGRYRSQPAWFVTDGSRRVIQSRRMDGLTWWTDGPKALTLPGGQGSWPVGASTMEPYSLVLLVEGSPDLLAALHFAPVSGVVAMLGAGHSIHLDALGLFTGKTVRIIPHLDAPDDKGRRAGQDAALRWQGQLQPIAHHVSILNLQDIISDCRLKDLNDATRLPQSQQSLIAQSVATQPLSLEHQNPA